LDQPGLVKEQVAATASQSAFILSLTTLESQEEGCKSQFVEKEGGHLHADAKEQYGSSLGISAAWARK
jgi:hypothetical protein